MTVFNSSKLLKSLQPALCLPISILINKSMETGQVPANMKIANIIPIYKSKENKATRSPEISREHLPPTPQFLLYICDIPGYRAFPLNTCIINISMYFGATEKWHVQMVMVIACCTIGRSVGRALWNTRLSIAQFMQYS